jgi:hypothetical protein
MEYSNELGNMIMDYSDSIMLAVYAAIMLVLIGSFVNIII